MSSLHNRQQIDRLRNLPLETVLRSIGAEQDHLDKAKWHTSQGALSVNGAKFINWNIGHGGGGAIDLAMHLNVMNFSAAIQWLADHFSCPDPVFSASSSPKSGLTLPLPEPGHLAKVKRYLLVDRRLPDVLLEPLIQSGRLYADHMANAVFVLLGKEKLPVGAELRGTSGYSWRGLASGSRKDLGCFAVGPQSAKDVILCESAIDAISCAAIHASHLCVSTSGARPNPAWLPRLIERGYNIYCGFDADPTGDQMAVAMINLHPSVERIRPSLHDWNDVIKASC
jgi:hypothetical protein